MRVNRPALVNATMRGVTAKYYEDMKTMNDIVNKSPSCSLHAREPLPTPRPVIADRRANPREDHDLLDLMLSGEDPKTGEQLSEENIRYQVRPFYPSQIRSSPKLMQLITFLIAGHETVKIVFPRSLFCG